MNLETERESIEERVVKSLWHVMIATIGIYELCDYKSKSELTRKLRAGLAYGLIAFHVDAAVCDALDTPTLFRRLLHCISGK